jgi:hypothetical protein
MTLYLYAKYMYKICYKQTLLALHLQKTVLTNSIYASTVACLACRCIWLTVAARRGGRRARRSYIQWPLLLLKEQPVCSQILAGGDASHYPQGWLPAIPAVKLQLFLIVKVSAVALPAKAVTRKNSREQAFFEDDMLAAHFFVSLLFQIRWHSSMCVLL